MASNAEGDAVSNASTASMITPAEITDADRQIRELINTYFDVIDDEQTPEAWTLAFKECISRTMLRGLSIAWKVYVRQYFAEKGINFPPGMFVQNALESILGPETTPGDPPATPASPPDRPALPPQQRVRTVRPDLSNLPNLRNLDNRFNTQDQQLLALAGAIDNINGRLSNAGSAGSAHSQDQSPRPAAPTPPQPANRSRSGARQLVQPPHAYSSIGTIRALPETRSSDRNRSQASSLLKIFSHASQQFAGTGDIKENLAALHQSYTDKCMTLGLTALEAFDNMYVLFVPNSPASVFYHKYVLPKSKNMEQAFSLLYSRFSSTERRDRLIRQWNNLHFKTFMAKPGATPHTALIDMCQTAELLQIQLGTAYQDNQHLRDVIMKAVSDEPFAALLALSPAQDSVAIQEACARAIQVHEDQLRVAKRSQGLLSAAAHAKETLFVPYNGNHSDRPGMHSRRYAHNNGGRRNTYVRWKDRRRDGLNPIRNGIRMRCRKCNSEKHFIRDCDQLDNTYRAQYAKRVLLTESVVSDPGDIDHALEIIQEFDDDTWKDFEHHFQSSPMASDSETTPSNETHFVTIAEHSLPLEPNIDPLYASLADVSTSHSILHSTDEIDSSTLRDHHQILFSERNGKSQFEGICMDNGCQKSLAGLPAYLRYCQHAHISPDLTPSTETFMLGDIVHPSIGRATIRVPIDTVGNFLEYDSDVVDVDIPILFGLDKMKSLKWYTNEVTNQFCSSDDNLQVNLAPKLGHLYLEWPVSVVLFTRSELLKIHRRFAHPSADKLTNLLRRASPENFEPSTKRVLQDISKHCNSCQRMAPKPFVFQVTLPDSIVFNHEIFLDLMWIEPRPHVPVLHIVDRGTHFSAAQFVKGESAEDIWNAFITCWVNVYVGFPNILTHDQGKLFTSEFFNSACVQFGIIPKATPTESHNSLGAGERYHAPLRKIYEKIKIEYPSLDNSVCLSLAVHALNNTAGPDGLVPTLLVFGMLPKIPLGNIEKLPPNHRDRFAALESARKEMETIVAAQRLKLAQKPRTKAIDVFSIPPGSPVLVYREKPKKWEGPFVLHSYDNYKTAYVNVNGAIKPFSITVVKQFFTEHPAAHEVPSPEEPSTCDVPTVQDLLDTLENSIGTNDSPPATSPVDALQESLDHIRLGVGREDAIQNGNTVYVVIVNNPKDPRFRQADYNEIKGLLDRGTYVVVNESEIPPDSTVLRSRVIHSIKKDGNPVYKSRLVIQGHRDPEKGHIVNEAPTILRSSVRIILSLSVSLGQPIWTRDVKQAFVQSDAELARRLFVRLPAQPPLLPLIDLPNDGLLQALKPLYGLSESPGYWWQTFKNYHTVDLGMTQSIMDPCLFFKREKEELIGAIGTLVDDTLGFGNSTFAALEQEKLSRFDVKPRDMSLPMKFGGCLIEVKGQLLLKHQFEYASTLSSLSPSRFSGEDFAHLRGQLAYIASNTRPDAAFVCAQLARVKAEEATPTDCRLLNASVAHVKKHPRGIPFAKLDLKTLVVRGYSDAAFANNGDSTSQLGMIILLCDGNGNANIIHYSSWKSRRITRSILAAEEYAFSACYDYAFTAAHDLSLMLDRQIPIHLFTDSKSIFDTITKLSGVSEKRLLIDIAALRQAYSSGEIENIGHISSEHNIADPLTKKMNSPILTTLLETATLHHPVNQWIIHEPTSHN